MGLDSYWYMCKSKHIYDKSHGVKSEKAAALRRYPKELKEINAERKGRPQFGCTYIKEEQYKIGYFRKFNAMHGWVVDNVGYEGYAGSDLYLTKNDARKLLKACEEVLSAEDKEEAALEWLPPTDGFFFGSQEVGEDYLDDVRELRNMLVRTLKAWEELEAKAKSEERWSLVYSASW